MTDNKIYVDSDVIISSFLSNKGAAYQLINKIDTPFPLSNYSKEEIIKVVEKLNIAEKKLEKFLKKVKTFNLSPKMILKNEKYVNDPNDAHIISAADKTKARFLITYNKKDYKTIKIKNDLQIIVLSPGEYLQYLRNLN